MERDPMLVDPGEFALDANPVVARPDGLIVPAHLEEQRRKREDFCFCGADAVEVFRGWGLCSMCRGPVKRRWRRQNRARPRMATSVKSR